jgi:hypothetical protein
MAIWIYFLQRNVGRLGKFFLESVVIKFFREKGRPMIKTPND